MLFAPAEPETAYLCDLCQQSEKRCSDSTQLAANAGSCGDSPFQWSTLTRVGTAYSPFSIATADLWGQDRVEVELKPFNDRALNRDLEVLCAKVAEAQPQLPDGRRLVFRVQGTALLLLHAQERTVA